MNQTLRLEIFFAVNSQKYNNKKKTATKHFRLTFKVCLKNAQKKTQTMTKKVVDFFSPRFRLTIQWRKWAENVLLNSTT